MIRLGLCCKFAEQPIKFYTTTVTAILKMERPAALRKLSGLCLTNTESLQKALAYCAANRIGAFRVSSQILPIRTHPEAGYTIEELPEAAEIIARFRACGAFARAHNLRLSFHPGQFTLLSSPDAGVTARSLADLEYHTQVAEWIGADVINIHGGGAYGDKAAALARVQRNLDRLSPATRLRLTLENDDKTYTPADLLPLCQSEDVPLVYDVHHHRVQQDGRSVAETTDLALSTWNREPLFHLSSPATGWYGPKPLYHHDYINPADFPASWLDLDITIEVEAKAKELAVLALRRYLDVITATY